MIRNYFSHSVRNILKNKAISIIILAGLSISFMLVLNLFIWVQNELSFDRFHDRHDRIYRILTKTVVPGKEESIVALCQGHLPGLIADIPQVEACARLLRSEAEIEFNKTRFAHYKILYTDTAFFRIFSFRVLSGNVAELLRNPSQIAVTKTVANKLFGSENAIGKIVKIGGTDFTVAGVFNDIPPNSHLNFDILTGFNRALLNSLVEHSGNEFLTYVLLRERVNKEEALKEITDKYTSFLNQTEKDLGLGAGTKSMGISQPLTEIELHSDNIGFDVQHGNLKDIWLASGLIVFILIIAVFNFISLIIVSAQARLREISIRKIAGATRRDLIFQFIGEALIISLGALVVAMFFLSSLTWKYFTDLVGKNLSMWKMTDPVVIIAMIVLCVIIAVLAGAYPAIYLSQKTVTDVLRRSASKGFRMNPFIKGIVLIQFSIVMFLVTCMTGFYKQINFIRAKDLGFDKEHVLAVDGLTGLTIKKYQTVKQQLALNTNIEKVCLAQGINVRDFSGQLLSRVGEGSPKIVVHHTRTSPGFIDLFRLNLIEGRDFDSTMVTDENNYILNEEAVKRLGFRESPIDQPIAMWDTGRVIGVVKDFNFDSMHKPVEPLVITLEQMRWGYIFIRLKPGFKRDDLDYITNVIRSTDPLYSPDYVFIDDTFNAMYMQEERIGKILNLVTYVSIILAFMGLLAITTFIILRKTKEIGIRKINGATRLELLVYLNKDYLRWIAYSFMISTPFAVISLRQWLDGFAYKVHLSWFIFCLSGLIVLAISVCTVSIICWKSANTNPVDTLRYE